MARPKQIEDNVLLPLIKEFFEGICGFDGDKLKLPALTEYIASRGYPGYRVESLRRNPVAREYIQKLINESKDSDYKVICAYKTLDIDHFLNTNRGIPSLKRALAKLDGYYAKLADAAAPLFKENETLRNKLEALKEKCKRYGTELEELEQKNMTLASKNRELTKRVAALQSLVDDYVYPDIANRILEETELSEVISIIDDFKLEQKLKTKESVILPMRKLTAIAIDEVNSGEEAIVPVFEEIVTKSSDISEDEVDIVSRMMSEF